MLARLAVWKPRTALMLAAVAGAWRNHITGRWPSAEEVAALFPNLTPRATARIAAAIGGLEERNDVFVRSIRRYGIDPVRPSVELPDAFRSLEGPCILATFHVGAIQTSGVALEVLGKPALAIRHRVLYHPRAPVQVVSSEGKVEERAAAFLQALRHLRSEGIVMMALDLGGQALETECLGRSLPLARGPFALARMTGAPIIPLAIRWTRRGTRVVAGLPLMPEADERAPEGLALEQALARAASRWIEDYLRDAPGQITLGLLRELLYGRLEQPAALVA